MNTFIKQDLETFAASFALSEELANKSFLITGATGLIGSTLIRCLLSLNINVQITVLVRSLDRANNILRELVDSIVVFQEDVDSFIENTVTSFDYIVHCASPTSGDYMAEYPVETFDYLIQSTRSLLQFSRKQCVKSFVYLSSIEFFGEISDDSSPLTEKQHGYIDHTSVRSSYPLGKRAAEYLCFAYAKEYGVPAKIARLTQTFGAGVSFEDNRVFAQFARSIVKGEDIVLHTKGESSKPYCYSIDCVSAILYILLRGDVGKAYNVANEDTYISIINLALYLQKRFNPAISVRIDERSNNYAPVTKCKLSTLELRSLGWSPLFDLELMFSHLIEYYRSLF